MPNTPALVRSAASVFVCGARATPKDATLTRALLESVGTCEEVTENLMDPITALSGSGPAYVSQTTTLMSKVLASSGDRGVAYHKLSSQSTNHSTRNVLVD